MIYGQPAEFKEAESAIKKIEDETDFTCGQMLLGKEAWPVLSSKIRFVNGLLAVLAVFLDSRTGYSSSWNIIFTDLVYMKPNLTCNTPVNFQFYKMKVHDDTAKMLLFFRM